MLALAFWILLATAVGGMLIAALDAGVAPVRLGHGLLGGLGLICLLVGALGQPGVLVWSAFGLLAIGLTIGALLFGVVYEDTVPPPALIAAHGLVNTVGIVLLGLAVFVFTGAGG